MRWEHGGGYQLARRAGGSGGDNRHPDRDRQGSGGWEAQAPMAVWRPHDKRAGELALLQAAMSRQAAGDLAQADALYERAVRLNRRNEEALHRWALVKQAIGQHNAALDLLNRVIQLNSKAATAYCHRGYVLQDMGLRREAAQSLERAVQLKPDYVDALIALGAVQGELGAFEAARTTLDRALVLDPRAREAVLNKGALFESQGLLKEAIAAFDAGLQTLPADAEMLHRKINCLHRLGELEAALDVCHVQLAARPGEARALTSMANTLRALGHVPEALAYHGRAMASASVRPDDLMDAAMCHLAAGNSPPAFVFMRAAGRRIAALSSWMLIISHSGKVSEILPGAQSSFGRTRAWVTRAIWALRVTAGDARCADSSRSTTGISATDLRRSGGSGDPNAGHTATSLRPVLSDHESATGVPSDARHDSASGSVPSCGCHAACTVAGAAGNARYGAHTRAQDWVVLGRQPAASAGSPAVYRAVGTGTIG